MAEEDTELQLKLERIENQLESLSVDNIVGAVLASVKDIVTDIVNDVVTAAVEEALERLRETDGTSETNETDESENGEGKEVDNNQDEINDLKVEIENLKSDLGLAVAQLTDLQSTNFDDGTTPSEPMEPELLTDKNITAITSGRGIIASEVLDGVYEISSTSKDFELENHNFTGSINVDDQNKIDVSLGKWVYGDSILTANAIQGLGSPEKPYIVVTVGADGTTATISEEADLPTSEKKRLLITLNYDVDDNLIDFLFNHFSDLKTIPVDNNPLKFHFQGSINANNEALCDISAGWFSRNGEPTTTSVAGIGGQSTPYIILTIDDPLKPVELTISAVATWTPDTKDRVNLKYLICKLIYVDGAIDYFKYDHVGSVDDTFSMPDSDYYDWLGNAGRPQGIVSTKTLEWDTTYHFWRLRDSSVASSQFKYAYLDGNNELTWIDAFIDVQHSIEYDNEDGAYQLIGDVFAPGNEKYYGTDEGGDKGWHTLPSDEIPPDGYKYQVLQKASDVSGDIEWNWVKAHA